MEGFTVALALVDAIPVLLFGASMILLGSRLQSLLFTVGAILSTLAGCCKVAWKLILGLKKKDVRWLNKGFLPLMGAGWLLILLSFLFYIPVAVGAGALPMLGMLMLPKTVCYKLMIIAFIKK